MVINKVRVRLSAQWWKTFPNSGVDKDRQGDGYETNKYWMVKWDGRHSYQAYAKHFIERVKDEH